MNIRTYDRTSLVGSRSYWLIFQFKISLHSVNLPTRIIVQTYPRRPNSKGRWTRSGFLVMALETVFKSLELSSIDFRSILLIVYRLKRELVHVLWPSQTTLCFSTTIYTLDGGLESGRPHSYFKRHYWCKVPYTTPRDCLCLLCNLKFSPLRQTDHVHRLKETEVWTK